MIRAAILAALLVSVPAHAIPVVNAASIMRAKCKRTPPDQRSLKCKRLVGNQ